MKIKDISEKRIIINELLSLSEDRKNTLQISLLCLVYPFPYRFLPLHESLNSYRHQPMYTTFFVTRLCLPINPAIVEWNSLRQVRLTWPQIAKSWIFSFFWVFGSPSLFLLFCTISLFLFRSLIFPKWSFISLCKAWTSFAIFLEVQKVLFFICHLLSPWIVVRITPWT